METTIMGFIGYITGLYWDQRKSASHSRNLFMPYWCSRESVGVDTYNDPYMILGLRGLVKGRVFAISGFGGVRFCGLVQGFGKFRV